MKTECLYRSHFSTRNEVEKPVAEYVHFCALT
ncbi:MAG: IS3 family transposase [Clostridia bacterium]|nr:IS3 family transposase [Clostridia bacterium]